MSLIDTNGIMSDPNVGYGAAFTPSEIEESMIRVSYPQLRGKLEIKWEKRGEIKTLYVRER